MSARGDSKGFYGVKLVRGPFVQLEPNPDSCTSSKDLKALVRSARSSGYRVAADLFCGAGGLSLGLEMAGWKTLVGVDHDADALQTHRHHFGGMTLDWDLADDDRVEELGKLLADVKVDLIAGGPPCQPFSKAGRSLIRELVRSGRRDAHDARKGLWQGFLRIIQTARPSAVLMENVPDMALDRDMLVLRTMVDELENIGYSVHARIVDTWRYEVPQHRQRLFLIALAENVGFTWPEPSEQPVTLRNAIGDLPPVEGGWRPKGGADGWCSYDTPRSRFQETARVGLPPEDEFRIRDHITRPVRPDDAEAFARMGPETKYSDLPEELKRYRDDIFDDKYKRLDYDDFCRTITAHISKDGYWYIHPEQDRTLSVREAARIQTFPDYFRFAGPPSAAFRQIGNAVPPNMGLALGKAILTSLDENRPNTTPTTRHVQQQLADWIVERSNEGRTAIPWMAEPVKALTTGAPVTSEMRWLALVGEILLGRSQPDSPKVGSWPGFADAVRDPKEVANSELLRLLAIGSPGQQNRTDRIVTLAKAVVAEGGDLTNNRILAELPEVGETLSQTVARMAPDQETDPIGGGNAVLRVAARFNGRGVDRRNVRTDGRMAVARMIGVDDEGGEQPAEANRAALAFMALIEISRCLCTVDVTDCFSCPLGKNCAEGADHLAE